MLAFPTMGMFWLGQVDALVMVGVVLALTGRNPYLRGAGLLLASIKPHVSGIALLLILIGDRQRWKMLIVPAAVLLLSFAVWGIDWPLRFVAGIPEPEPPAWDFGSLFPVGLVAFGAIFLVREPRQRVAASLLAAALGAPWYGVYSGVTYLPFFSTWLALPLGYAWVLAFPLLGNSALRFTWLLPLGLLVVLIWPELRRLQTRKQKPPPQPDGGDQSVQDGSTQRVT
jgi:hypothetical protein